MDATRAVLITYRRGGQSRHASGIHLSTGKILTARHCLGGSDYAVWVGDRRYPLTQTLWESGTKHVDLALVFCPNLPIVDPMPIALVERSKDATLENCRCVGFSGFKRTSLGSTTAILRAHVIRGTIHVSENLPIKQEETTPSTLTLNLDKSTTTPFESDDAGEMRAAWGGVSGAGVRVTGGGREFCIGVVTHWEPQESSTSLSVTPLNAVRTLPAEVSDAFWNLLGESELTLTRLPAPSSALNTIPHLLGNEVPRPELLNRLRELLRSPSKLVGVTASLLGTGGFGKTVLAQLAAHDDRIRSAYPRVLWLTLGQETVGPALAARISDLLVALGAPPIGLKDPLLAGAAVLQALGETHCLIILDDVWYYPQLEPFLSHGSNTKILVTTRNAYCLPDDSDIISVGQMGDHEATATLTAGLKMDRPSIRVLELLSGLLEQSGRWPVLLGLLNASIRLAADEMPLEQAIELHLEALRRDGPTTLDMMSEVGRRRAIRATLSVSFRALEVTEIERFYELAVFPEDVEIPVSVLEHFWHHQGLDPLQVMALRRKLVARSLIMEGGMAGSVRLHDVIRSFLRHEVADLRALAEQFCHATAINPTGANGHTWEDLSAEAYIWEWSVWHAIEAGMQDVAAGILHNHEYLVNKLEILGVASLERDLRLVEHHQDLFLDRLGKVLSQVQHLLGSGLSKRGVANTLLVRISDSEGIGQLAASLRKSIVSGCLLEPDAAMPDILPQNLIRVFPHPAPVIRVAVNELDGWLLTVDTKATGRFWHLSSGQQIRAVFPASRSMVVNRSGNWAATCDNASIIRIWSVFQSDPIATIREHVGHVLDIGAPEDPETLVVYSNLGRTEWSVRPDPSITSASLGASWNYGGMSQDGNWVRERAMVRRGPSGMQPQGDSVWFAPSIDRFTHVAKHSWRIPPHDHWRISRSGRLLIAHGSNYSLMRDGVGDFSFPELSMPISCVEFSPDDQVVVAGRFDGGIQLARSSDYRSIRLNAHRGSVADLAWMSDSKRFLSAGSDGLVCMWELDFPPGDPEESTMIGQVYRLAANSENGLLYVITPGSTAVWSLRDRIQIAADTARFSWRWGPTNDELSPTIQADSTTLWLPPPPKEVAGGLASDDVEDSQSLEFAPPSDIDVPEIGGINVILRRSTGTAKVMITGENAKLWSRLQVRDSLTRAMDLDGVTVVLRNGSMEAWSTRHPGTSELGLVRSGIVGEEFTVLSSLFSPETRVLALGGSESLRKLAAVCDDGFVRILSVTRSHDSLSMIFALETSIRCNTLGEDLQCVEFIGMRTLFVVSMSANYWIDIPSNSYTRDPLVGACDVASAGLREYSGLPFEVRSRVVHQGAREYVFTSDGTVRIIDSGSLEELGAVRLADRLSTLVLGLPEQVVCGGSRGLYFFRVVEALQ